MCYMTMKLVHVFWGHAKLCSLYVWFLALRLIRQEQSAPTLGDMIEKVLPGELQTQM